MTQILKKPINSKRATQENSITFEENWKSETFEKLSHPYSSEHLTLNESFSVLDVGCGNGRLAKGSVNVDFFCRGQNVQIGKQLEGEFVDPHKIPNFILADACHLPFKNGSFNFVFSSHVIEHVADPLLMFKEMHRVSKRMVVVRCPHRRGSGAKRPFHVNYLDERWFRTAASILGCDSKQFVSCYDPVFSSKLSFGQLLQNTLFMKLIKHAERRWVSPKLGVPFEIESWSNLSPVKAADRVHFVVASNRKDILDQCFKRGVIDDFTIFENKNHVPLPTLFNRYIDGLGRSNEWIVFCHQDFILKENIESTLSDLDVNAVYGVIGVRPNVTGLFGRIQQTDGSYIGRRINKPEPVQTLDEMCLIVHSSMFKKGLRFDERLPFDFYGADLCMQAFSKGFGVYAIQVDCQHKSASVHGGTETTYFKEAQKVFAEKWSKFVPIRTTSAWIDNIPHTAVLATLKKKFLVN